MAEKLLYVLQYAVIQSASTLRIFDLLLRETPQPCLVQAHPAVPLVHIKIAQLCGQASLCEGQEATSLYQTVPEAVFKTARRGPVFTRSADGQACQVHKPIKMAGKVRT